MAACRVFLCFERKQGASRRKGDAMNMRKEIDYSTMHAALDLAVARNLSQMEMYCEIGKAICARSERGEAVAAAIYPTRCPS